MRTSLPRESSRSAIRRRSSVAASSLRLVVTVDLRRRQSCRRSTSDVRWYSSCSIAAFHSVQTVAFSAERSAYVST